MAKFTPNGLECYLQKIDSAATPPTPLAITSFTAAAPVVLTMAADPSSTVEDGELVTINDTNSPLDGNTYIASTISATNVTLLGSDLVGYSGTLTGGELSPVDSGDMLRFCLSSYEREIAAADAIDVSTFCGAESLAGTPTPGTIAIEGFIDYQVEAYNEWRKAVSDGIPRLFHIVLPPAVGGEIIMTITPSGLTETFAVNEAASFTGEAIINKEPVYIV